MLSGEIALMNNHYYYKCVYSININCFFINIVFRSFSLLSSENKIIRFGTECCHFNKIYKVNHFLTEKK